MFYRGKKVLVTGGTGFIGTNLVEELLKAGARVRVPLHKRQPALFHEGVEYVEGDLASLDDAASLCSGVDYVFHAGGAVAAAAVNATNPMSAIATNLVLGVRILEGAWKAGVERILMFSSSTGYPVADHAVTEEEFWSGPTYAGYFGYGWMRRYIERLSEFVAQKSSMKVALVRPTAVYGPYDDFDPTASHVIPGLIRKAVERMSPYVVWGDGTEVRDFLHVRDLARGCLLAVEKHAECDPLNIGYGKAVTIGEVVRTVLASAGYADAQVVFDASKPTAIPVRIVDTSKAERVLGFRPEISLEDGLRETVAWYKARG